MKSMLSLAALLVVVVGCSGRPELFPNSDTMLRKPSTAFAADAAKRFPYKLDIARAGVADARAQVGYSLNVIEATNLSGEEWNDVELWVNQEYVVFLPRMEPGKLKRMPFQMLFNEQGHSFPTNNGKVRVERIEIIRDGRIYDVKMQLAD